MHNFGNNIFETNEFALQVISSGWFLDNDESFNGKMFAVETATVRLNHVALDEYIMKASLLNCRECYDTDEEWAKYSETKKRNLEQFNAKVAKATGFETDGLTITQVQSEVFALCRIFEIK